MIRQWSYQQYGEAIPTHGGQSEVQVAKVHKSYTIFFYKGFDAHNSKLQGIINNKKVFITMKNWHLLSKTT